MNIRKKEYLKSTIFGIEDSLVSTTGLIAGLSVGADDKKIVVLGAIIAIGVESLSMGAGEYLSDDAVQDLEKIVKNRDNPLLSGFLMFVSYLLAGFVPLLPIVFLQFPGSLIISIVLALAGLFMLGYIKGKLLKTSRLRGAFKILIVGGIATLMGVLIGVVFKI